MPIPDILLAINEEMTRLEQARSILQGTSTSPAMPPRAKRGRPPGTTARHFAPAKQPRTMSEDGRARIAAAQKARWAAKKSADRKAARSAATPVAAKKAATPSKKKPAKKTVLPTKTAAKKVVQRAKKVPIKNAVPANRSLKSRAVPAKKTAPQPVVPESPQVTPSESSSHE